ncbi:MAG: hypothetical protein KGI60_01760 [Patescibacteria group bacterium]|nr:hypothetical protein [Patescibacteria group bacterium]
MRFTIPQLAISSPYFLRKCGYIEIQNPHKNLEISYARSLDPGRFYPRFHVYLETANDGTNASIHLDMKKPSYEGSSAHSGEYDGPVVAEEVARIKSVMARFLHQEPSPQTRIGFAPPRKSWWQKLFG